MRARTAMLLTVVLALAPAPAQAAKPARARLAAFSSCPDLLAFARGQAVRTGTTGGVVVRALGGVPQPLGVQRRSAATAPEAAAPTTTGGSADDTSSTTNVQEAGVDEPDIVKSDARRAFLLSGSSLLAYDIAADVPRLVGSLELGGYGGELLVRGSRVLVIQGGGGIGVAEGVAQGVAERAIAPGAYRQQVQLTEVDVSDPAAMKVARTMQVDGAYVSARLTGGTARVVLNTPPVLTAGPATSTDATAAAAKLSLGAFLPETVLHSNVSGRTFRRQLAGCTQVRHAVPFSGLDLLTVLSIDLDHGLFNVDRDAVMAGAQVVYASPGSLYVASQRYVRGGIDAVSDVPDGMRTEIHRFDTSDAGRTAYRSTGSVPGFVLNQFALSEYRDHLRVASTEDPPWLANGTQAGTRQSSVSVLAEQDGRLVTTGRVGGLGEGERIYAVRFIGDTGYVVTFRQVDPLYTVDLADPANPRVLGELKIAGYSAYLHPVGDDLLLGVGQDASEAGLRAGPQVSLFDVSDLRVPKRLAHRPLTSSGAGSSEAEWDHHAFLWWGPEALAVLPVQSYGAGEAFSGAVGLRVRRSTGIAEVGRIAHKTASGQAVVRRALVAGSRLITVSDAAIAAANLDTLAPLGLTELPGQTGGGGIVPLPAVAAAGARRASP